DQFILQQLAADQLLKENRRVAGVESAKSRRRGIEDSAPATQLAALGFLTLGGRFMNNTQDILDDRIDVVCRGLLGLTVTCARCHDHKYDPIPSRDYYSLYGVFASCAEPTVPPLFTAPPRTEAYAKFEKELKERERKLEDFVRAKNAEGM